MIMKVTHQKKKYKGEKLIFIGEDAHPYADKNLLIVADGLGGRGGYPHTAINRDIVDKTKFYDLVFGTLYPDAPEDFKECVLENFDEIFKTADYYFTEPEATRTSGYFASRLVSSIILYELKYGKRLNREMLFERLDKLEKEPVLEDEKTEAPSENLTRVEEKPAEATEKPAEIGVFERAISGAASAEAPAPEKAYLKEVGAGSETVEEGAKEAKESVQTPTAEKPTEPAKPEKRYDEWLGEKTVENTVKAYAFAVSELLKTQLKKIIDAVGFKIETKLSGAYLLPSTLTVALCNEHEESVDIVYLWAGDSRGYLWNSDGLAQVTEDHEKDETMTNLITVSKSDFFVEGRILKGVKKPFLAFNATDGCYKCPVFASPLDLEYLFITSVLSSENFEKAGKLLEEQFKAIGRHDDSNTLALSSFGYADYSEVKSALSRREEDIKRLYLQGENGLEGLFERDYPSELNAARQKLATSANSYKERLIKEEGIRALVAEQLKSSSFGPYRNKAKEKEAAISGFELENKRLKGEIYDFVKAHWIKQPCFRRYSDKKDKPVMQKGGIFGMKAVDSVKFYAGYKTGEAELEALKEKYKNDIERAVELYKNTVKKADEFANGLLNMTSVLEKNFKHNDFNDFNENFKTAFKNFETVCLNSCGNFKIARQKVDNINNEVAEAEAEAIKKLAEEISSDPMWFEKREIPAETLGGIDGKVTKIGENLSQIAELKAQIEKLPAEFIDGYWDINSKQIISFVLENRQDLIPDYMRSDDNKDMLVCEKAVDELEKFCTLREKIYEEYQKVYNRFN